MSLMHCTACGERFPARTSMQAEFGSCPECSSEDIVEVDAYDDEAAELRCGRCGFEVEAGIQIEWDEQTRIFTVDEDCPVCELEGVLGESLGPADAVGSIRDEPEYGVARAAARSVREGTVGHGVPVDVRAIAGQLGLTVERGDFEHEDGMLRGSVIEVPRRNFSNVALAREIMGMPWASRDGLREAIPPVYTEFIGSQLLAHVCAVAA